MVVGGLMLRQVYLVNICTLTIIGRPRHHRSSGW
jgi:hypothetical protein